MFSPKSAKYHILPTDNTASVDIYRKRPHYALGWTTKNARRHILKFLGPFVLFTIFASCATFTWFMLSELRQELIAVQHVKCASPPWYLFASRTSGVEYYKPDELVVPGNGTARVGMVQTCSVPVKRWSLSLLLENHRAYAERWNVPWQVRVDIQGESWSKIIAAREWMARELQKPEDERLEWLLYVLHSLPRTCRRLLTEPGQLLGRRYHAGQSGGAA
jgi:hypothetical protein